MPKYNPVIKTIDTTTIAYFPRLNCENGLGYLNFNKFFAHICIILMLHQQ